MAKYKLQIPVDNWLFGEESRNGDSQMYQPYTKKQCCLGHLASKCLGFTLDQLEGTNYPQDLLNSLENNNEQVSFEGTPFEDGPWVCKCLSANDDLKHPFLRTVMTVEQRKELITELFAEKDIELEFV